MTAEKTADTTTAKPAQRTVKEDSTIDAREQAEEEEEYGSGSGVGDDEAANMADFHKAHAASTATEAADTTDECENKHPECQKWADIGECTANPGYMLVSCAVSCKSCDKIK
jgi:hypothetical protein